MEVCKTKVHYCVPWLAYSYCRHHCSRWVATGVWLGSTVDKNCILTFPDSTIIKLISLCRTVDSCRFVCRLEGRTSNRQRSNRNSQPRRIINVKLVSYAPVYELHQAVHLSWRSTHSPTRTPGFQNSIYSCTVPWYYICFHLGLLCAYYLCLFMLCVLSSLSLSLCVLSLAVANCQSSCCVFSNLGLHLHRLRWRSYAHTFNFARIQNVISGH